MAYHGTSSPRPCDIVGHAWRPRDGRRDGRQARGSQTRPPAADRASDLSPPSPRRLEQSNTSASWAAVCPASCRRTASRRAASKAFRASGPPPEVVTRARVERPDGSGCSAKSSHRSPHWGASGTPKAEDAQRASARAAVNPRPRDEASVRYPTRPRLAPRRTARTIGPIGEQATAGRRARVSHPRVPASWTVDPAGPERRAIPGFPGPALAQDLARRMLKGKRKEWARRGRMRVRDARHEIETRPERRDGRFRCDLAGPRTASACGGCFHPPTQTVTDITDERMLLSVSTTQSTLYDQIEYSGVALELRVGAAHPRHGDRGPERRRPLRFDRRADGDADQSPASELPVAELLLCAPRTRGVGLGRRRTATGRPVQVLAQANVGPYATVQLHRATRARSTTG